MFLHAMQNICLPLMAVEAIMQTLLLIGVITSITELFCFGKPILQEFTISALKMLPKDLCAADQGLKVADVVLCDKVPQFRFFVNGICSTFLIMSR